MLDSLCLNIDTQLPQGHYKVQHTLELNKGVIGVYGCSGQGKTTLLKIIAGLIDVNTDALMWDRHTHSAQSPEINQAVYQAQTPYLFAHLTVTQNLQLVLKHAMKPSLFAFNDVIKWCAIEDLLEQPIVTLSGGERQRVAFARSLLCGKHLILLDEPFSAIDVNMRQRLLALVLHLQQTTSVRFIMVSHALSELAFICHEIIALNAGEITQIGPPHLHLQQDDKDCPVSYLSLQQPQYDPQYNLIKWQLSADIDCDINIYSDALNQTDESATSYRWLINSDAITLSYEQQTQSSILNQIPVTVTHIETCEQHVIVELSVAEQQLLVKISHLAHANLSSEDRFKPGISMWAQLPLCSLSSNLL